MILFFFSFIIIFGILAADKQTHIRSLSGFIIFFAVIIAGLRVNDLDYYAYKCFYDQINANTSIGFFFSSVNGYELETSFVLLSMFEKLIYGKFEVFIFLASLISVLLKYFVFRKMSNEISLTVLLYMSSYFFIELVQIRNVWCGSCILLSLFFLGNNKYFASYIAVLVAILCHRTGFIALPIVLLFKYVKTKEKYFYLMLIFSFLIFCLTDGVGKYIFILFKLLNPDFNSKYVGTVGGGFGINYIVTFIICLISLLFSKRLVIQNKYFSVLLFTLTYGLCLSIIFHDIPIFSTRIRETFCSLSQCLLIPIICNKIKYQNGLKNIIYLIVFVYIGARLLHHVPLMLSYQCLLY